MTGYVLTAVADTHSPDLRDDILTWAARRGPVREARFVERGCALLLRVAFWAPARRLAAIRNDFAERLAPRTPSWHVQALGQQRLLVLADGTTDVFAALLDHNKDQALGGRIVAAVGTSPAAGVVAHRHGVPFEQAGAGSSVLLDVVDRHLVDVVVDTSAGLLDGLGDALEQRRITTLALRTDGALASVHYATGTPHAPVITSGPRSDAASLVVDAVRAHCAGRVVITAGRGELL
jgi:hypothetical protein